jgi:hypothetical protein
MHVFGGYNRQKRMRSVADLMEDIVGKCWDHGHARGPSYFSMSPLFAFLSDMVQIAKAQERQTIIDALPRREKGHSAEWNEGYNAAMTAVIRLLVQRSVAP